MSGPQRVELSKTEGAFVAMVNEEHTALVRQATARRAERLAVLFLEKGVPDGAQVDLVAEGGVFVAITWPAPGGPP